MNALTDTPVFLVPMQAHDLDEIHRIERDIQDFPWTPGNFRDALEAGYLCHVWREDGAIAGYGVVMMALDEAHLLNISVARHFQRRGFGRRLLAALSGIASAAGGTSMLLEVRPSNGAARALYRSAGFREIGMRKGYYPAAHGREDAIVLQVAL